MMLKMILLQIRDINDNPPSFEFAEVFGIISTDNTIGEIIATIKVRQLIQIIPRELIMT